MIRIITDSTSEISIEKAKELNIDVVALNIIFDNVTYKDQIDLEVNEFYEKLKCVDKLPTTSQPSPNEFLDIFEKYKGDTIIGIFLSSKLSGTFQSAYIAKNMIDDNNNIHLIDSKTATLGIQVLVMHAVKLRDANEDAKVIVNEINKLLDRVKVIAYVDTIKYLKMGGRINGVKALLSTSLGISPLIGVEDGVIVSVNKTRGKNKANNLMIKYTQSYPIDENHVVVYGHANCYNYLINFIDKHNYSNEYNISEIGAVIGTHSGPNAYGIAYISKV